MIKAKDLRIGSSYKTNVDFPMGSLSAKINVTKDKTAFVLTEQAAKVLFTSYTSLGNDCFDLLDFIDPIPINEKELLKLGWKYYNGKKSGNLTRDFGGKIDCDFIDGKICIKSHYEGESKYRELHHFKFIHQLQNLYFDLEIEGEELIYKT